MKKTEPFRAPSLAEADETYRAIQKRIAELGDERIATEEAIAKLDDDIRSRPAPGIRAEVAALIGQTVDAELAGRGARRRELRKHSDDIEAAIEILRRQLADRVGPASVAACALVRDEYGHRIAGLAAALEAANAARLYADALLDDLEAEGIQLSYLPALRANFLGDRKDGHVAQFVREAREAGYV